MKKVLLTITGFIAVAMLFTGVGYAAANWLSFTGDEQVEQSKNNVDEILAILEKVSAEGKIDKEQVEVLTARVKELEDMNPSGLAKINQELRKENEQLKNDKAILSTNLASKEKELDSKQTEINNKQQEINDKNSAYDVLQKERDGIAVERDNYKNQVDENSNYIKHLEAELTKANKLVEEHANYTEQAVEKARTYK